MNYEPEKIINKKYLYMGDQTIGDQTVSIYSYKTGVLTFIFAVDNIQPWLGLDLGEFCYYPEIQTNSFQKKKIFSQTNFLSAWKKIHNQKCEVNDALKSEIVNGHKNNVQQFNDDAINVRQEKEKKDAILPKVLRQIKESESYKYLAEDIGKKMEPSPKQSLLIDEELSSVNDILISFNNLSNDSKAFRAWKTDFDKTYNALKPNSGKYNIHLFNLMSYFKETVETIMFENNKFMMTRNEIKQFGEYQLNQRLMEEEEQCVGCRLI